MTDTMEGDFPPEEKSLLIKVAETWLRVDDAHFKLGKLFETIKAWMSHWTDRGPEDHDRSEREQLRDLIRKTVRATVEIQGDYNEGGSGSSPSWRNWVMGMLGTLIVIGVTGLIVMYGNQKAMSERMDAMRQRMDGFDTRLTNIERKILP